MESKPTMTCTKQGQFKRGIAVAAILSFGAPTGCGYLLYPERRGTQSGTIDSATMVMDLLWLLPGILPGVVALIVDFSSGAIYVRGGAALRLPPNGRVTVRLPRSPRAMRLDFRAVTASRRVVAQQTVSIGPSGPDGQSVELAIGEGIRRHRGGGDAASHEELHLEVHTDEGQSARLVTGIEIENPAM